MTNNLRTYLFSIIALFFSVLQTTVAQNKLVDSIIKEINLSQQAASISIKNQDYTSALKSLTKANKIVIEIENDTLQANVRLSIAELYYYLQNFNKAAKETDAAIEVIKNGDDIYKLAKSYLLNGLIHTRIRDFEESEFFLNEANKIYVTIDDEKNRANVLFGMGVLELKRENFSKAIHYLDAAIPLFKKYKIPYQEAFAQLNKAEALLKLNTISDKDYIDFIEIANTSTERALYIINKYNYAKLKTDSYKISSEIASLRGQNNKAINLLQQYSKGKEEIYQKFINTLSVGIDEESKIGDLNATIAKQQTTIKESQQSYNFIKMTTGLSIALIVILSLLTLSLYKNNNLRAKANNLLQDKNTELQLSKEKAEQASLAKAQFLSTITHELRTPLYAVTGLTHLLLEENPKEHQKEHLNSLRFSGEYLLSLINNILDLNKLEANKVEIERTSFDLKKRINDVLVALKKSADDKKNILRLEYDENIPSKLEGDPLKLSQVLINLIGNSLKFTQNGEVVVRVSKLSESGKRVTLHFEVEDNGVGISQKKQKTIFESFSQASLQINRKFGGTGLGLSIVKNLLELMNSKIQLESQLGQGSKFWFNIAIEVAELSKEEKNNVNALSEFEYQSLEHKHVLVVEDNKINQMITRKILEKNQIVCQVADNGLDAVDLVAKNKFDVVLMDIHMPGISGIEATQKIRKFDTEIPIIALTAVTIDENLDEFYKAGFNDIIPKPFKTEEFFQKIHKNVRRNSTLS